MEAEDGPTALFLALDVSSATLDRPCTVRQW